MFRDDAKYATSFKLRINAISDITNVNVEGHPLKVGTTGKTATIDSGKLSGKSSLAGKDLSVTFTTQEDGVPSALLQRNVSGQTAGMISFFPRFLEMYETEGDLEGLGEFIFLLDRSGSMACGQRMKLANDAAIFFVKSLPASSYFNIISYGHPHMKPMWPKSVPYTEENVAHAVKQIKGF